MLQLDGLALELLAPVAIWVFLSGLDDVLLDLGSVWFWLRSRPWRRRRAPATTNSAPTPRIALLVPCWREADVIGRMLERNLRSIRYSNYDVWVGLYPNDRESVDAVRGLAVRDARVRYVVGGRPGPTTKADNLNRLFQGILKHEREAGVRYEAFLQHDAEDVIDPDSLSLTAELLQDHDFIQFPVLPLATPVEKWTHGVYCDEFAEGHLRDLPARSQIGGFLPSAGVGTALSREAVDRLRILDGDSIFDPRSLTEDYFLGLQVWRLGLRQCFAPSTGGGGRRTATRAFFPENFRAAVRQRTRWVIGTTLQAWERFGWIRRPGQAYWLWRDRKGLVGHPVSILANLLFLYGAGGAASAALGGVEWRLGSAVLERPWLVQLLAANLALLIWRQAARIFLTSRVYGIRVGAAAPLRSLWANVINAAAVARALAIWAKARFLRTPLRWAKTAHAFPAASDG